MNRSISILDTKRNINPLDPSVAEYFDVDQICYIVEFNGKPRAITSFGPLSEFEDIGSRREFHADQSGRHLGTGTVIGIVDFMTMNTEGSIPDRGLAHWVVK